MTYVATINTPGYLPDGTEEQDETEARQKLAKIRAEIRTERKRLS